MLTQQWRDEVWSKLDQSWDIIIIGGGLQRGFCAKATRLGLRRCSLSSETSVGGTSSRSSKLVHGGIRYLKEGKLRLTLTSVQERERLMEEGPGLIDPLGFLLATYKGDFPGKWTYGAGLTIYDLLALQWSHTYYSAADFELLAAHRA